MRASSSARIRRVASVGTVSTASAARPSSLAAFCTLKCPAAEVMTRSRDSTCGRSGRVATPPTARRYASSRASSMAWRFDWVPPLVNTPSAVGPSPIRPAVHSISRRSISVAPALWSQVSSEEFTALSTASPSSAGMTTGQLRWAR